MLTKEKTEYSLTALASSGYWFCQHCQRIVILGDEAEPPAQCPRCHKRTVEWQEPVNTDQNN
jgi:rubrerythrin